jgi:phenylacetate-CoA ligase
MPFVRSRTGDIGALSAQQCPCGLPQPILMCLDGRSTDTVYRANGSSVAGLMLTDLCTDVPSFRFAQFVQDSPNTLDVMLVTTAD